LLNLMRSGVNTGARSSDRRRNVPDPSSRLKSFAQCETRSMTTRSSSPTRARRPHS
jgi:hypothetical protein